MRRLAVLLATILLAATIAVPASAQDAASPASPTVAAQVVPEPYRAEEFHPFFRGLRRFETVVIGSFPLAVFYTSLVFDCYRLVSKSLEAGVLDSRYMPWPLKAADSVALTNDEKIGVLLGAASVSILIGVIDAVIVRAKVKANERRKSAQAAEARRRAEEAAKEAASADATAPPPAEEPLPAEEPSPAEGS